MKITKTVRKNIIFPEGLISRFNVINGDLGMDFSTFVRKSVEEKIKQQENLKLQKELVEGYTANADLDRATCEEFKYVDGENV